MQQPGTTPTEMTQLKKEFEQMRDDVKEIRDALLGSKYNEGDGLVNFIKDHEDRITWIEKRLESGKWLVIGLSLGAGAGIPTIIGAIVDIFHK